jgi:hypothetical protein
MATDFDFPEKLEKAVIEEVITKVQGLIDARIEHPLYMFDSNKLNKKKVTMTIPEILKERIMIFEDLKKEILNLRKEQMEEKSK